MISPIALRTDEKTQRVFDGASYGDPTTRFSESIHKAAIGLESRTSEQLARDGRELQDPVFREHALFQLMTREGAKAFPVLKEALYEDTDSDLRINTLWTLEWLPSPEASKVALDLCNDADSRVQEWARVFCWEMGWSDQDFRRKREFNHIEGRTFDETIYLHIAANLYIRLGEGHDMWGHMLLSPQMLARVYGQALACPIVESREKEIVISKTLEGLHADGSDHYETFLFRGFTERTTPLSGNFYFETQTDRPFFRSGRANDMSEGMVDRITVPFAREGQWFLNDSIEVRGKKAIEYVRGLFQGWAFVNLERIEEAGGEFLFPGNSVLSTLHHPEVGDITNTFINGRFKGKVVDWNGDGKLDLNYLKSYATAKGEVDSNLDGIADEPGLTTSMNPAV
ncbi:MAG: HEAT repeat domain-containing protein [Acidobacteriota bacterium]